jgi:hypothetical protein
MTTPNLSLPELAASQAQPHITVNSSLRRLDAIAALSVADKVAAVPTGSPEPLEGERYLITDGAEIDQIAYYSGGAWIYLEPQPGWLCWVQDDRDLLVFEGANSPTGWTTVVSL